VTAGRSAAAVTAGSTGGSAKVNVAIHPQLPHRSDISPPVFAVGTIAAENVGGAGITVVTVSGISHTTFDDAVSSADGLLASSAQLVPSRTSHSTKLCGRPRPKKGRARPKPDTP
jgi:hypothetical protein